MSPLNAEYEIAVREQPPIGARMFTGDDFNYVGLIEGSGPSTSSGTHSDALLGAFAALDRHDAAEYRRILGPTEELARQMFAHADSLL